MELPGSPSLPSPLEGDVLYEVVNGRRVEVPPMGAQESSIANLLARYIWRSLGDDPPGHVVVEMLFALAAGGLFQRRPDLAYVSFERWPQRVVPPGNAWEVVPNLAVEVVSPTNTALEIQDKIDDYFNHGVGQVWIIYPPHRRIHVYEGIKTIHVLDASDVLEGGSILPEFRLAVSKLFEVLPQSN
jgi:Uma2 family endonuclease